MRRTAPEAAGSAPILDSGRARRRVTLLAVLIAVAVYLVTMSWAASVESESRSGRDGLWLWGSMAGFAVGLFLHVVVHELGHLMAAGLLRLRVVGVRIWGLRFGAPRSAPANSNGHVTVALGLARRWVPFRMTVVLLAGPAANVAVAALTTTVAANRSASTELRVGAVGATVAGFYLAIGNLLPRRPTSGLATTDGRKALRWIFRPARERARMVLRTDLARLRAISSSTGQESAGPRHDHLVSAVGDPVPRFPSSP